MLRGTVGTAGTPGTTGRLFVSFGCSSPFLQSDFVACYAVAERESAHSGGSAMTFEEMLAQVLAVLQHEKRVSYRALKRRFALDDDYLEDVKDELIYAKKLAIDEENRVLVWTGNVEGPVETASSPD